MTSFGSNIARENSRKNAQNIQIKNEIDTYCFYQFGTCENITNQPKTNQECIVNFFGIFCKKFGMHIGSGSRNIGAISKKMEKDRRKPHSPRSKAPNPRYRRIQIILDALETLDWSGCPRNRIQWLVRRGSGPGQNRPDPRTYIKGSRSGLLHFFLRFSFFFSRSLLFSPNPNPSFTQIHPETVQSCTRSFLLLI